MTKEQFIKIAVLLRTAYSTSRFLTEKESMSTWYEFLKDLTPQQFEKAVKTHICTSKFPPTIAEIRSLTVESGENSWVSGYELLKRSIVLFGYYREAEALDWMLQQDPIAGKVAKALGYKQLCESEAQQNDRAQFRMAYEQFKIKQDRQAILPAELRGPETNLKRLIQDVALKLSLEKGGEDE